MGNPPEVTERDIVYQIKLLGTPGYVAEFWRDKVRPYKAAWSHPLSELEEGYVTAFRDPSTPTAISIKAPLNATNLSADQKSEARLVFGNGTAAAEQYANYHNRRLIVNHYFFTHPSTVGVQIEVFRISRDALPLFWALERGWRIGSGREMFTGREVSRLGAAGEFIASLAIIYGIGRVFEAVKPAPEIRLIGPKQPLDQPVYALPVEGGGMYIGRRWYTEHALERMAPDIPEVRGLITKRVVERLERAGVRPGDPSYGKLLEKALKKAEPRGIPPAVVEAEILRPGSTNIIVITANRGQTVVTVMKNPAIPRLPRRFGPGF